MERYPLEKLSLFFAKGKRITYKKHQTILRPNTVPRGVYFLKKGFVREYALSREGQELTLILFKEHDIFPLRWTINNVLPTLYFEAMSQTEVFLAPKKTLLTFLHQNPDVLFALTGQMLTRVGGLLKRTEYMVFGNAYQKVAALLVICSERFGKSQGNGILIEASLTHKDLGLLLGMARETVSNQMSKLEKKNIIAFKNHLLFIRDIEVLRCESLLDD